MRSATVAMAIVLCLGVAQANEYFVATTGSDANPGTVEAPFLSPQRGVDAATQAGDIVTFRGGTYTVAATISCVTSGAAGNPIRYRGYPGETAVLRAADIGTDVIQVQASHLVLSALTARDGQVGIRLEVSIDGQNLVTASPGDVAIEDCVVTDNYGWAGIQIDCGGGDAHAVPRGRGISIRRCLLQNNGVTDHHHGVYIDAGDDVVIEDCIARGNSGFGLHFYADKQHGYEDIVMGGHRPVARRNRIYGNGFRGNNGCGIVLASGESPLLTADEGWSGAIVENNFLYDNHDYGIEIETWGASPRVWTTNAVVRNNTLFRNHVGQAHLGLSAGVTFANNLLSRGGLDVDDIEVTQQASSLRIDANFYEGPDAASFVLPDGRSVAFAGWRAGGFDARGFQGDAAFVDRNAPDLHLGQASQAIDRGAGDEGLHAADDIDGDPRPSGAGIDMGADEFEAAVRPVPPALVSPAPGSRMTSAVATFQWTAGSAATGYWLYVGRSVGARDVFDSGSLGTNLSATVTTLPTDGSTLYVRLWYLQGGVWPFVDATFTAATLGTPVPPALVSPAPGSRLASAAATFTWRAGSAATAYWLYVGRTAGGRDVFDSGSLGTNQSATVGTLPTDGSTLYVRLWYLQGGVWLYVDATFTAAIRAVPPAMVSPTPRSTLTSSSATFAWSAGSAATAYWLYVGRTVGARDVLDSGSLGMNLTTTVTTLPTDGSTLYARLWYLQGGVWLFVDATFTAATLTASAAVGSFTSLGPGGGGAITSALFDPTDANRIYVT